jgi:tetratricopeptide (TPR) repeat protein
MNHDNIYNDLYFRYYNLGSGAYSDKVWFYEEFIQKNNALLYEEKLDLTIDYVQALFSIGKYQKYLSQIDPIIEQVVRENIFTINDHDIFQELLFKKAASLYNLDKLEESISILNQLIKINPKQKDYKSLYWIAKVKQKIKKIF